MALKPLKNKIQNSAKKHDNQDLSKQDNTEENKKKSKLRKKKTTSQHFYQLDSSVEINNNLRILKKSTENAMESYYGPNSVVPNYSVPYSWSQWDLIAAQIPNQLYTVPVPTVPVALISPPLPLLPTPVLSFTDVLYTPTYSTVMPYVADNICSALDHIYDPISSFAELTPVTSTDKYNEIVEEVREGMECLEYYLTLPKDLFPRATMLNTLDPNPIIDELCRIKEINKHSPWILDLEFGIPRTPTSRPIAVYDVQYNNIHCMNAPGVHPMFGSCSDEFRRVFLFYYDGIVSVWYRSYIHMTNDDSVMNFQNWLMVPIATLGMCWA